MAVRLFVLAALCASCSALVVTPAAAPALRPRAAASPSISMVDAGHAVDAASQLMALSAPIPAYSIPKVQVASPASAVGGWVRHTRASQTRGSVALSG
jgi:hypothetical protein